MDEIKNLQNFDENCLCMPNIYTKCLFIISLSIAVLLFFDDGIKKELDFFQAQKKLILDNCLLHFEQQLSLRR